MISRQSPSTLREQIARCGTIAAVVLALGAVTSAQAPTTQAYAATALHDSYYAAGERVNVPAPVNGDAVVAGREITVAQPVMGDILAAGGTVTIMSPVGDDVRVAGRQVNLNAAIDGDLTAAGGTLTMGPNSRVTGKAWLAGGDVRADGVFERDTRIAGRRVQIAGELRQPIHVTAQELDILPTARIMAPITYEGPVAARIAPAATLIYPVAYRNVPADDSGFGWPIVSSLIFTLHLFVGGLLIFLLLPRFALDPGRVLREEPGLSLVTGLLLFVLVPLAALLLVITLVGIPIGLALGALYLIALFVGLIVTAFSIGRVEAGYLHAPLATRTQQALYLLAGVVTLAVIRLIPVLGTVAVFLGVLYGLGALGLWLYRGYSNWVSATA